MKPLLLTLFVAVAVLSWNAPDISSTEFAPNLRLAYQHPEILRWGVADEGHLDGWTVKDCDGDGYSPKTAKAVICGDGWGLQFIGSNVAISGNTIISTVGAIRRK